MAQSSDRGRYIPTAASLRSTILWLLACRAEHRYGTVSKISPNDCPQKHGSMRKG